MKNQHDPAQNENENQNAEQDFRELNAQVQQAVRDMAWRDKILSQEGMALASLFVSLTHALRDSELLDESALFDNLRHAVKTYLKGGDALAAHHVHQMYVNLINQFYHQHVDDD